MKKAHCDYCNKLTLIELLRIDKHSVDAGRLCPPCMKYFEKSRTTGFYCETLV